MPAKKWEPLAELQAAAKVAFVPAKKPTRFQKRLRNVTKRQAVIMLGARKRKPQRRLTLQPNPHI